MLLGSEKYVVGAQKKDNGILANHWWAQWAPTNATAILKKMVGAKNRTFAKSHWSGTGQFENALVGARKKKAMDK